MVMVTPEEHRNDNTEAEAEEPTLLPLLTHLMETTEDRKLVNYQLNISKCSNKKVFTSSQTL